MSNDFLNHLKGSIIFMRNEFHVKMWKIQILISPLAKFSAKGNSPTVKV